MIASYGFCRTTIYKWLNKVKRGGRGDPLRSQKATGRPSKLTMKQKRQVLRWINGKDPRQYGFATLIAERFGVELSPASVGKLLAELGLTPQKPLQRAYERHPAAIEEAHYPSEARKGAEIYFWDESGFRADAVQGTTWGMKGETPGKRQSVSAASAVNAKGTFWFATYQDGRTAELFVAMLEQILRGRRKVESNNGNLELHFLPGYAPVLNPDELVWNYVKRTGTAKKLLASH